MAVTTLQSMGFYTKVVAMTGQKVFMYRFRKNLPSGCNISGENQENPQSWGGYGTGPGAVATPRSSRKLRTPPQWCT